jgi:hypothetical protein
MREHKQASLEIIAVNVKAIPGIQKPDGLMG